MILLLQMMHKVKFVNSAQEIMFLHVLRDKSLYKLLLVEEPGFKNVKNKHFGMSPF